MRKFSLWIIGMLVAASVLQQCAEQDEGAIMEKVRFTCSFGDIDGTGGRIKEDQVPDALLLSLETSTGESIFLHKQIALLRLGDSFITEPLNLPPGRYSITDFILIKDETEVLFATPRQGAPLAPAVNHPLPYQFTVKRNQVSNIDMEVIDIGYRDPEDFGYESFPIGNPNVLSLGVLIRQGSDPILTDAIAYLLEDDDTINTYVLQADINEISFNGNPRFSRKLVIVKPGYNTETKAFVYKDLIAELGGEPWEIELTPSIFTLIPRYTHFEVTMEGQPGTLAIDWGDGTSDTYALVTDGVLVGHTYGSAGTYPVTITGDLGNIQFLRYGPDGIGAMSAINLQGLSGLIGISMGLTESPEVMDFSHNHLLQFAAMPRALQLKTVMLPENSVIKYLNVSGSNQMTTSDIDNVIDQVYAGVVANQTMSGTFWLETRFEVDDSLLGPPSPDRVDKLRELRDTYSWFVRPDPLF